MKKKEKKEKKAKNSLKPFIITTSILVALCLTVTLVTTQFPLAKNTFNSLFGEERRVVTKGDPSQAQYFTKDEGIVTKADALANANRVNEEICEEGFVLLKNEDSLPLERGAKISVFGMNSVDMVYGGSGSSAKSTADGVDLYASLQDAGFETNPELKAFYEAKKNAGKGRSTKLNFNTGVLAGLETGELALSEYDKDIAAYAGDYTDAAVVVFSRVGGEGYDLPRTMEGIEGADPTDHYLQLDRNERALLEALCAEDSGFDNVIVIVNSAASMELGFLEEMEDNGKLKGAIWIGTTGGTGLAALGRIMNGEVNPSGRLVDTYARNFKDAPSWQNFSTNLSAGGNRYQVDGADQNAYFVDYEEGIYVGYRYYETRGYTEYQKNGNDSWYENAVVYPFGYGLSYSNFDWKLERVSLDGQEIASGTELTTEDAEKTLTAEVTVTNRADSLYSGKDVVQLYYQAPYTDGGIEKSHVVLGAFAKTGLLAPGESETVTLSLNVRDMASYDYADLNQNGSKAYELDSGEYTLHIGRNAHDAWAGNGMGFALELGETIVCATDSATGNEVANRFDDVSDHIETYLSRSDWEGTWPITPTVEDRNVDQALIDSMTVEAYIGQGSSVDIGKKWYQEKKPRQQRTPLEYNETELKLYDLIDKDYDDPAWEKLLSELTVKQMRYLVGTGNFNTAAIDAIAKPKTIDPDGPAGFASFMSATEATAVVYDTCFYASECVVGATWNVELAEKMGNAVGNEALVGNERGDGRPYSGWYAPAVNIHRSPFSGRNWEYYSEDGLLSGKMASGVVQGAQKKGVYTMMKHFAFNDQETDRDSNGLITWLNEQAMREIYLKPFEVAVKEGGTMGIMSSFNRVGTVWAGGCYELLTEILRDEWGFRGLVITDYANAYMNPDQMIRAGGDLCLFQDQQPSSSGLMVNASHLVALRKAVKNILYTVSRSNAMNGMGNGVEYAYVMPYWQMVVFGLDAVVLLLCVVRGICLHKKRKTQKQMA